jgi:hypothetical protein
MLLVCRACAADLHGECYSPDSNDCCCATVEAMLNQVSGVPKEDRSVGSRDYKDSKSSIDPKSTGRKRAARDYPIHNGMPCEWRGLANAGGALSIVGCIDGIATHRHHGPNKDTLHNEKGNVHRICTKCHNRWHTRNDGSYNWNGPWEPHDPDTKATDQQLMESEIYWAGNKAQKAGKD